MGHQNLFRNAPRALRGCVLELQRKIRIFEPNRRQVLSLGGGLLCGVESVLAQEPSPWEKIKLRGALKVAVYKDNAPYSDGSDSDVRGVDVSLARALATKLGLQVAWLPFDAGENVNDDLRNMVWKGHYLGYGPADVMMHVPVDRYLMDQNKQVLIFAPYVKEQFVLLHQKSKQPNVNTPEDLPGQSIGAEMGSGAASTMMGYGAGLVRDKVVLFQDGLQAARAAISGQVNVAYVSRAQAEAALHMAGAKGDWALSSLNIPSAISMGWSVGMAVKSDNPTLAAALDDALQALRKSGELLKIFDAQGLTLLPP